MGLFQAVTDFLESIFKGSSPEYLKKQELRKMEAAVKAVEPAIYRNGMLQPNVGGLFKILYDNTRLIQSILSQTLCTKDESRNKKFEECLMETGFSNEAQGILESLSIENRKNDIITSDLNMKQVFEGHKRTFERVIKEANTEDFKKIDSVIARLKQLYDLSCYDYMEILQKFDPDFSVIGGTSNPSFRAISIDVAGGLLQDFYYITASLKIDAALGRALSALNLLNHGEAEASDADKKIVACLKKISAIHTKILTPEILKNLILLWRQDSSYVIQASSYNSDASKGFVKYLQTRFDSDENRIKMEIKDRNVAIEQKKLFGEAGLVEVEGYNAATNQILTECTSFAFSYISPLQILKTFQQIFFTDIIKNLLEDIVIEGFFSNSSDKTDFSSRVYATKEYSNQIMDFEKSFGRGAPNDVALIKGYIDDGCKDPDFIKKLGAMVEGINSDAFKIIQEQVRGFRDLYATLNEILMDSRKSKSDIVVNIKVLLNSSRNRDAAQVLEQQFPHWVTFFEIMKNYAIIGDIEKK